MALDRQRIWCFSMSHATRAPDPDFGDAKRKVSVLPSGENLRASSVAVPLGNGRIDCPVARSKSVTPESSAHATNVPSGEIAGAPSIFFIAMARLFSGAAHS